MKIKKLIKNSNYLLLLILILGFFIRLYYIRSSPSGIDEGNYLYSAKLILEGKIPFKDYLAREPLFFYILAFFSKLFGIDLLISRGIALFSSVGIIYLTYRIGRELYSDVIGLISAFLFAFSPFIIYYGFVGRLESIFMFTVTTSFYFLIIAFRYDKSRYYLLFGLLLGASILLYRMSTIFLLTIPFLFVIVKRGEFLKQIFQKALTAYIGITVSLIPILIFFITITNFKWMDMAFGTNKIIIAYILFMPILVISFMIDKHILRKHSSLVILIGSFFAVSFVYYSFSYLGVDFSQKARIFYGITRETLYLLVPTFLFLYYYFGATILNNKKLNHKMFTIIGFLIIYFVFLGISAKPYSNVMDLEKNFEYFFIILIILFIISIFYLMEIDDNIFEKTNFSNTFLVFIFISLLIFSLWYSQWLVWYFLYYTVISCLMSAVVLFKIYNYSKEAQVGIFSVRRVIYPFFIVLILSSAIFSQFTYAKAADPDRQLKISTVEEVSKYIALNTGYNERIFTAEGIFAVYAERHLVLDIVHPALYYNITPQGIVGVSDPLPYDPYNTLPPVSEITNYLEKNKIKYIVAGPLTNSLFISNKHPNMRNYIRSNYYIEKEIDNISIYRRYDIDMNRYGVYVGKFETDTWKEDSYSFYGIARGTTFGGSGNDAGIYPRLTDEMTYIIYGFNFTMLADSVILRVTGNKRELMHNLTVWIVQDNTTYIKIIEFDNLLDTTKQADITNYIKNNQTWIEFRFFRSSKGENTPRILDFSITAIPTSKGNKTMLIRPYKKDKLTMSTEKVLDYNHTNILIEPSFENYKNSNKPPIAWAFTSNNGGVGQIDNTSFDENYSYRINVNNATNDDADLSQTININNIIYYKLIIAYKQSGNGDAIVMIQWFDEKWKKVGEDKLGLTANSTWNTAYIERRIPANTKHGRVILQYLTNKGDTGTVWFDDIQLYTAQED